MSRSAFNVCSVAVAARGLEGNVLARELVDGELSNRTAEALDDDTALLAFHQVDRQRHHLRRWCRGGVDHRIDAFAATDLVDALPDIFRIRLQREVGSQFATDLKAASIARETRQDDEIRAGRFGSHDRRESLLAWTHDN